MTDAEREAVLEAVADGVLDALRSDGMPHLKLSVKLHVANIARRTVAERIGAVQLGRASA